MAVGLGARKSNMDTKFMVTPPTSDVTMSGGVSSGRVMIPFLPQNGGEDTAYLWVWGITIAAIVYMLGVHWTLGNIRSLAD